MATLSHKKSPPSSILRVVGENANTRLDQFLVQTHPKQSRSYWQKEIKAGRVRINSTITTPRQKVETGDVVAITEPPAAAAPGPVPKLIILAETPDYLVIKKPAGLLVHATETSNEPTLVDAILKHDPAIAHIGENPKRPGIVHRLDREASGIMIIAKTQNMFDHLKSAFANREVKKEYHALVHGTIKKDEGEITFSIDRAEGKGRMAAKPTKDASGREARTTFEVLQRFRNATLVLARAKTGRTHQIRAHFHALGHPLMGDTLYKIKKQKTEKINPPRLMLHATKLSFPDLNGNKKIYESPLPQSFIDVLENQS